MAAGNQLTYVGDVSVGKDKHTIIFIELWMTHVSLMLSVAWRVAITDAFDAMA
jgi:hypothetical protein